MHHNDINYGWLTFLPAWLRPYALLSRWDRPVGIWLLLLPSWWGLFLASPTAPHYSLILLFAVGAVVMRGAGCTINDMLDCQLDAQVERTRQRPLPSGMLTMRDAGLWLVGQLAVGAAILFTLPWLAILLGCGAVVLIGLYPLMKRVTWLPQLFLGITFNWGVLMGAATVTPIFTPEIWFCYAGAVLWTLFYDTIYAYQDVADDRKVGIKSTALLFGTTPKPALAIIALLSIFCFTTSGWLGDLRWGYQLGLMAVTTHFTWQLVRWQPQSASSSLHIFRSNRDLGLWLLAGIIAGKLF